MGLVLKTVSCLIIVATLFYYNEMMELSGELALANETIEEISASMEEMAVSINEMSAPLTASGGAAAAPSPESQGKYLDGTYSGTAQGYGGPVTTELTIENGNIVGIAITSSDGEDAAYYNMCLGILDEIAQTQGADVDAVSGATLTSIGIIDGAKEALASAARE
jgi:uncharacterized protein with FMN-binding domain